MVSSNNHTHCGNNVRILPGSGAPEIWMEILTPTPSPGEPNLVFKLISLLTTIIDLNMTKTPISFHAEKYHLNTKSVYTRKRFEFRFSIMSTAFINLAISTTIAQYS